MDMEVVIIMCREMIFLHHITLHQDTEGVRLMHVGSRYMGLTPNVS
jgi:hypothetical protein